MEIKKANRVTHTYIQTIQGTPKTIFPLYCPVREKEWCEGWDPKTVYSESGVVEPDCVFVTEEDGMESTWYVTVYDAKNKYVEMIQHTPGVVISKLKITIEPISDKETKASITYGITSLGNAGDEVLKEFTRENFNISMDAWEKAMNHFLKTGEMLTGLPKF